MINIRQFNVPSKPRSKYRVNTYSAINTNSNSTNAGIQGLPYTVDEFGNYVIDNTVIFKGNVKSEKAVIAYQLAESTDNNQVYALKKHTHSINEIVGLEDRLQEAANSGGSADLSLYLSKEDAASLYQPKGNYLTSIPTTYALKTDIPTTLPASDVYSWAKQINKPTYTASEVGALGKTETATNSDKLGNIVATNYFHTGNCNNSTTDWIARNGVFYGGLNVWEDIITTGDIWGDRSINAVGNINTENWFVGHGLEAFAEIKCTKGMYNTPANKHTFNKGIDVLGDTIIRGNLKVTGYSNAYSKATESDGINFVYNESGYIPNESSDKSENRVPSMLITEQLRQMALSTYRWGYAINYAYNNVGGSSGMSVNALSSSATLSQVIDAYNDLAAKHNKVVAVITAIRTNKPSLPTI